MVFKDFYILVFWANVVSALEGLIDVIPTLSLIPDLSLFVFYLQVMKRKAVWRTAAQLPRNSGEYDRRQGAPLFPLTQTRVEQ